jgi:hypothetical protein
VLLNGNNFRDGYLPYGGMDIPSNEMIIPLYRFEKYAKLAEIPHFKFYLKNFFKKFHTACYLL